MLVLELKRPRSPVDFTQMLLLLLTRSQQADWSGMNFAAPFRADTIHARQLGTVGAMVLTLAVGYADYATGLEVRVFPLYFIPVGLVAWTASPRAGLLVAVAAISVWELANRLDGLRYSTAAIEAWNVVVQFAALAAFSTLLSRLRALTERERASARIDSLTGLSNARDFHERARQELERARRSARPLVVAYVDLDNFKAVNDLHGHHAGDQVLRLVGRVLLSSCRQTDLAARLGGDEFALLIPEMEAPAATKALERVRDELAGALAEHNELVTASIGAICFTEAPSSVEELLGAADALMYRVKQNGKNGLIVEARA